MAQGKRRINVHAAIACDDVREERNGKEILIGVYSNAIWTPHRGVTVVFCVWVQWSCSTKEPVTFKIRVLGPNNLVLLEGGTEVEFEKENDLASFTMGGIRFQMQSEGFVKVELQEEGFSWKNILTLPVKIMTGPPAEAESAASQGVS